MKTRTWIVLALAAASLAGATTVVLVSRQSAALRAAVLAGLPPQPDLAGRNPELRRRIEDCGRRISGDAGAVAALGDLGRLYHANGFPSEASQCYQALLAAEPRNPLWPHALARLLSGYGRIDDALPLMRRVVALDPAYTPAQIRLGDALLKTNQTAAAVEAYTRVLAKEPGHPFALVGLARADVAAGRWTSACERLEAASRKSRLAIGGDLLATAYEKVGRADRALKVRAIQKASGAFYENLDPWIDGLVEYCYDFYQISVSAGTADHSGDTPAATRILQRALTLEPDNHLGQFQMGIFRMKLQDYGAARKHLERCVALAPGFADGYAHLSNVLETVGDRTGSERVLATGLANCPYSPGLHLQHAQQLNAAGRYEEAIPEYRTTIRLRPDEVYPYIDLAKIHFRANRIEEGVAELEAALKIEPEHPSVMSTLAAHAIMTGDPLRAGQWIRRLRDQPRTTAEELAAVTEAYRRRYGTAPD